MPTFKPLLTLTLSPTLNFILPHPIFLFSFIISIPLSSIINICFVFKSSITHMYSLSSSRFSTNTTLYSSSQGTMSPYLKSFNLLGNLFLIKSLYVEYCLPLFITLTLSPTLNLDSFLNKSSKLVILQPSLI